jgi:hypothetical protein
MTISYPLPFPTITRLTNFILRERSVVAVTGAPFSGQQQIQEHSGSWWEAEFDIRPLPQDLYDQWGSFFSKLHGRSGTFLMGDPLKRTTRGNAALLGGVPQVDGSGQRGSTLAIRTGLGNLTGYLREGDFFSIGLGSARRMHKVLNDVTLVGGKAIIDIWPRLRYSPPDGDLIYFTDATTQFRLSANIVQVGAAGSDGGLRRIPTITCIEAF